MDRVKTPDVFCSLFHWHLSHDCAVATWWRRGEERSSGMASEVCIKYWRWEWPGNEAIIKVGNTLSQAWQGQTLIPVYRVNLVIQCL